MLTQKEHQAMIMFDRLLMEAEQNETVADLLDQTLNVARMLDPNPEEKIQYGPLQRMHFEWQQMKFRMDSLEKKMENYINNQNRYYPGSYTGSTGYPLTSSTTGSSTMWPSNPGWDMSTMTSSDVNKLYGDQHIKDISEKLRNISLSAGSTDCITPKDAK